MIGQATITLSGVEQAAVLRHLELQRCRLSPAHEDHPVLERLICRFATDRVTAVSVVEASVVMKYLRAQHRKLDDDLLAIEERRINQGITSHLSDAWRALDADSMMLEDVIRRVWILLCTAR